MINVSGYFEEEMKLALLKVNKPSLNNENGYYYTVIYCDTSNKFSLNIGEVYDCCGAVQLKDLSIDKNNHEYNVKTFKHVLKAILKQNNNIVTYLTAQDYTHIQNYIAVLLSEIGFQPVFVAKNRNSENVCTLWVADLTKLSL